LPRLNIDFEGRTPLYLAAEHGQKSIVRYLIDIGCNEKVSNIEGQKALFWIIAKCPEFVMSYFIVYIILIFFNENLKNLCLIFV
jgi:ankyrin repeat protein